jgi:hypothetical protein
MELLSSGEHSRVLLEIYRDYSSDVADIIVASKDENL